MKTIVTRFFEDGYLIEQVAQHKLKKDGTPYKRPTSVVAMTAGIRMKRCTNCRVWKPFEREFRIFKRNPDGRFHHCTKCERGYFSKYDRSEKGRERFVRRAKLEAGVIPAPPGYHEYIRDFFDNRCAITGERGDVVLDHFIPLSWGCVGNEQGNLIPITSELNKVKRNRNVFDVVEGLPAEHQHRFYSRVLPWIAEENDMSVAEYFDHVNLMEKNRHRKG